MSLCIRSRLQKWAKAIIPQLLAIRMKDGTEAFYADIVVQTVINEPFGSLQ